MSKFFEGFTGLVIEYDPVLDVDEYIVCSHGQASQQLGHSTHSSLRLAKLAQINLYIDHGIDAWIEHIPAMGPPGIESQLDAAIQENRYVSCTT